MESVYNFSMAEILAFALVFLRMLGFIVTMPIIGTSSVSTQAKLLLSITLAMIIFPQVGWQKLTADIDSLAIVTMAAKELFIGLTLGFISRLFFMVILMAGDIMSVSLGLSAAQLFNPAMESSSTALDQYYLMLASLFFFAINGHHVLISGIFDSFSLVPISKELINVSALAHFGELTDKVMVLAIKLASPIFVSILFMNIAVAVIGKAVPQINILITSLPINAMAGFFIIFVSIPLLVWQLSDLLNFTAGELFKLIKAY